MSKPRPGPAADTHAAAFGGAVGEIWKSMQGLSMPLPALSNLQADYLKEAVALWNGVLGSTSGGSTPPATPQRDRRFAAADWSS